MRKTFFTMLALICCTIGVMAKVGKGNGVFSVGEGAAVKFSTGNLQYRGSDKTWRFAEHQYDIIGNDPGNMNYEYTSGYSSWMDLFCWATSGVNSPVENINNSPKTHNSNLGDYGSGAGLNVNWATSCPNYDWGANAIVNGSNVDTAYTWRTLTNAEWDYLISTRPNARNLYTMACVNGVKGMILMPDNWTGDLPVIYKFSSTTNVFTKSQWEDNYEAEGCIFLPAAGYRIDVVFWNVNEYGYYWSSTSSSSQSSNACLIYFKGLGVYAKVGSQHRNYCFSVRLAKDAPIKTDAEVTTPPAAVNRSYDASTQALITAGTATGGTMKYSLTSGSGYSTDLPTAKNAGTYTVYYMVEGDATHNDVAEASLEVTISKVGLTVTADNKAVTCGESAPAYTAQYNGFVGGETEAVLGGTLAFACDYTTTSAAGDYTITPSGLTSDNYTITFQTGTLTATAAAPVVVTIDVPTHQDPLNSQWYYTTFYHGTQNYALTNDATEAFVADLSGTDLVLTKIAEGEQVIPANTGVIFRKSYSADPVVLAPTDAAGVSFTANNDLKGVDVQTDLTAIDGLTADNCYILSGQADDLSVVGVGFYKVNKSYLKEHKAYVKYVGSQDSAPRRMRFVFEQENTATGMESIQPSAVSCQKVLRDGQLIIIRNGVEYNANGQAVSER